MLAFVLAAAMLVAAAAAPGALAQSPGTQVVWVDGTDITSLDGGFVIDVVTTTLLDLIFSHVVRYRPDMTIAPDLAESWSVAPDRLTWTFKLRHGLKFSNGDPVTAEAVKFSIDRIMDPKTAAPNRSVFAAFDRVEAPDPTTLRILTESPFPDLLQALADRAAVILDPAEAKKYPHPRDVGLHPTGSGPYMLAAWEPGVRLVLRRNPLSPVRPAADAIVYRPVPEEGTRLAMLRSGEGDIVTRPAPEEVPALRRDSRFRLLVKPGYNFIMYEMLTDRKPLNDVRVRWAINYAVDKKALVVKILGGLAQEACSTVSPGVGGEFYFPQPCYDYNPAKARDLLARAGYRDGFDLAIWSSEGRYIRDREVSQAIQGYLNAVGIRTKVEFFEWATFLKKWTDPNRQMWDIGRSAGFTDFMFTRLFARSQWDSGANNNTRFYDRRVEEFLVKARSTFDVAERAKAYRAIQEITWKYAPALYLYTQSIVVAHRSSISGIQAQPNEVLVLDRVTKR